MTKGRGAVGAVALLLALAGCSGDVVPFEEAIEVRDLGLETLEIEPPLASRVGPLFMNPGERIPFTLAGSGDNAGAIEVGSNGRRWRVSDSRYASIDGNGVLTALADGSFTIEVNIGDVAAQGFDVQVRDAALESIVDIERAERTDVPETLDPCVPAPFVAIGMYNDQTTRRLTNVDWDVVEGSGARRETQDDGSVRLTGTLPGEVLVEAASGGIVAMLPVTVGDTLRSLRIGSTGTLRREVGGTLELNATGTYGPVDGVTRELDVTQSVDWNVSEGTAFASVTTGDTTRGVVEALSAGTAEVRASCGSGVDTTASFLSTDDTSTDGANTLSFQGVTPGSTAGDGGTLRLSRSQLLNQVGGDGSRQLVLLRDGDVIGSGVIWQLVDDGSGTTGTTTSPGLGGSSDQRIGQLDANGRFTPFSDGTAVVQATFGGLSSRLTIIVSQ